MGFRIIAAYTILYAITTFARVTPHLIGGDVDEHGCNSSAGYVWSDIKERCIRKWEN